MQLYRYRALSEIYVNSVCDHVKLKFVWVCSFWRVLDLVAWVRAENGDEPKSENAPFQLPFSCSHTFRKSLRNEARQPWQNRTRRVHSPTLSSLQLRMVL